MDSKMLFEAAREGRVEVLERLPQENPSILADVRLTSPGESVLHVASKSGHLNFVNEIMKIDPDIARELNKDGFRPLDIAVIMGNLAIVKALLGFDRDLGRLVGKDNRTALHYAAVKGRVEIIDELLSICPDSLQDNTVHGETALHLAVKYYQFDAFVELVKWLERLSKGSVINTQDGDGNTVLHLAVSTKQYACVKLLMGENCFMSATTELNVRNGKGLTALDISDIVAEDSYDGKVRELLQNGGAVRALGSPCPTIIAAEHTTRLETNSQQPVQHDDHPQSEKLDWLEYFKFQKDRDSPSDTRNAMLIVAALITTITFQAGVTPPSGLFDTSQKTSNSTTPTTASMGGGDFIFLFFNTLGFTASSLIIAYLTIGFPLYWGLWVSLFSIGWTYAAAFVITVSEKNLERKLKFIAYSVLTIQFFMVCLKYFPRKYWRRAVRNDQLPIANSSNTS